jgi:hypothetical protein
MITANGVNVNGGLGITTNVGDTYSVAIKGNDVWYAINGQWIINSGSSFSLGDFDLSTPTVANWTFTGEVAPGCAGDQSGSNPLGASINFGQQPFKYTPPAGYKTFEVDNLPAVTVADGSDGFRALEAPGGAILPVAQGLNNDMYGSTGFTSGLWWIKDIQNTNQWHVAYCFASVPGYSSIGSYTGNGNADGPFIYTGFTPAFVMLKRTVSSPTGLCMIAL